MLGSPANNAVRYEKKEKLSSGAYGTVYKAFDHVQQEYVALKKLFYSEWEQNGIPTLVIREITALKELQHPNVIQLRDIYFQQNTIYLVFELMKGDLKQYIDNYPSNQPISKQQIKIILTQVLKALHLCRVKGFIHRDIKPQNILYDDQNNFKLTDFGISRLAQIEKRDYTPNEVVTLWYRCPELLLGFNNYTQAIDMWSVGCVFFELVTKRPFFDGQSEMDQLTKIFKILGTPNTCLLYTSPSPRDS
eukprot:TRINITY_DN8128_c0_g1_i2.p1 TRINITY_DN8128_c0_g1~~TRINITY_DN8128_c0_g1_i2.p1  ORF type:complete len:248 (-),score=27.77 TRINITY_DN8128_c0_g1_i2:110-853(-)